MDNEPATNLADLTFDFEGYFERHRTGRMPDAEAKEFDARMIGMFCRDVFQGGPGAVKPWVAKAIANGMFKVLNGEDWDCALPMPWSPDFSPFSLVEQRALEVYCAVTNALTANPKAGLVKLLEAEAASRKKAFSTMSGDYYKIKEWIDKGDKGEPIE